MKLKNKDELRVGDIVHFRAGHKSEIVPESYWLENKTVRGLKYFFSHDEESDVKKVTRKNENRISRKEYKRRIETAIQLIELVAYDDEVNYEWTGIDSDDIQRVVGILRGEE